MDEMGFDRDGVAATPSVVRNTAIASAMFVGKAAFAMLATIIVARELGPSGRGEWLYYSNLAGLIALAVGVGTGAGLNRMVADESVQPRDLYRPSVVLGVITGFGGAAFFVATELVRHATDLSPARIIPVAAATVGLVVLANVTQVASLDNRIGVISWTTLAGAAVYLVVTVVTAFSSTMSVDNNLIAWTATALVPLILLVWPVRLGSASAPKTPGAVRRLASLAFRANVATISTIALWRIDVVLVEAKRGPRELGLYSIAVALAEIVLIAMMALRAAVLPHHTGDRGELDQILMRVTRIGVAAGTALALVLVVSGRTLIPLIFGPAYDGAYPAFVLLLPGVVALGLQYPIFDVLVARGMLRALSIIGVAALVFNVVTNLVFLSHFSFNAAAAISSISYAFIFVACVMLFAGDAGVRVRDVVLLKGSDISGLRGELARRSPRPPEG